MTKETLNVALYALVNGEPCNTTNDFSVSVQNHLYAKEHKYSLAIYPNTKFAFFTEMHISFLMAVAQAVNGLFAIHVRNGVPVVLIN